MLLQMVNDRFEGFFTRQIKVGFNYLLKLVFFKCPFFNNNCMGRLTLPHGGNCLFYLRSCTLGIFPKDFIRNAKGIKKRHGDFSLLDMLMLIMDPRLPSPSDK